MFSKVLIANRGEIAVRVIRTAKAMGFRTVAVYSEADIDAPHVQLADEAVCIGPAPVGESYLLADNIIEACRKSGADAVHPGYGFLSENADFARACQAAGLEFIGPPVDAIELMGSKRLSKLAMLEADVPCIPGYVGSDQSDEKLISEAKRIGFPVMIKASAGGGGRGMRLVFEESELASQIKTARSEAKNAFGSGELILEKALIRPRHIEIQVFADKHGNAVYLGERDCSIQRRHQKVVEEAPSPFVDPDLRRRMGEAAVQAAKSCNYVGAGTVEFLVDQDKNFYFLEMNTRLQVEHPVTELVTGTDLVAWQLKVAAGEQLPLSQDEIRIQGHAIEVRLYAEDPAQNFMPQTGPILQWSPDEGEGVRIDAGIRTGQQVTPFYDPMLAKVITYGATREEARRRLIRAVQDSVLFGVTTNQTFLANILAHPAFIEGQATTAFIGEEFGQDPSLSVQPATPLATALGAVLLYRSKADRHPAGLFSWRSANPAPWPFELRSGEQKLNVTVAAEAHDHYTVSIGDESVELQAVTEQAGKFVFVANGVRQSARYTRQGDDIYLLHHGCYFQFTDLTHEAAASEDAAGSGRILASMDGSIVDVQVSAGDHVKKGQTLVILEAMKMEHPLKADADGVVKTVNVKTGDQVKIRQLLVEIDVEN